MLDLDSPNRIEGPCASELFRNAECFMHCELRSFFFIRVYIELRKSVDIPFTKEARKIFELCRALSCLILLKRFLLL